MRRLAILCGMWTAFVPGTLLAVSPPAVPCDTERVIAQLYAPCTTPDVLPVLPGYTVERLYSCSTLLAMRTATLPSGATALSSAFVDALETSFVLHYLSGDIDATQITYIQGAGYTQLEQSCPIRSFGASDIVLAYGANESAGASRSDSGSTSSLSSVPYAPWHLEATGADETLAYIPGLIDVSSIARPRVAVLDTGVDANRLPDVATEGWSGVDGHWLDDPMGHGTSVAGLVLQSSGGMADLVSIQVLNDLGVGTQLNLARGMAEAIFTHHAQVLNMSLGYPADEKLPEGVFPDYLQKIFEASALMDVATFAAAGNRCGFSDEEACRPFFPAAANEMLGTSYPIYSINGFNTGKVASAQAISPRAGQFYAPSEFLCLPTSFDADASGYHRSSGTSYAAPQYAGSLALLRAYADMAGLRERVEPYSTHDGALFSEEMLDLCSAYSVLGEVIPGCTIDIFNVAAQDSNCPSHPASSTFAELYAQSDAGTLASGTAYVTFQPTSTTADEMALEPLDVGREAIWCDGLSSMPNIPTCTSCDYCTNLSANGRLVVRIGSLSSIYTDHQLRVSSGGSLFYFALPSFSGASNFDFTLDPGTTLPGPVDEVWLLGLNLGSWSSTLLYQRQCLL